MGPIPSFTVKSKSIGHRLRAYREQRDERLESEPQQRQRQQQH